MDDDEYFNELMTKATSVVVYKWQDCVDGFKQADIDMGSAFHRKLEWMNRAADIYLKENDKMAGFVKQFADDCGISHRYAYSINGKRQSFLHCTVKNFSHDALDILSYVPEELREDIVSSNKPMTASEVVEAKTNYNDVQTKPEFADIKSNLNSGTITPFGAAEEVKERKARTLIVPDYDINEAMGAILGISMMYAKEYTGEPQDAAQVLLDRIMEGYDTDDIGLSMARDCAKWFLSLKKVMDLVGPELEDFLTDKPNLTVVN